MNTVRPSQVSLFRCRVVRSFRLQPPLTPTDALLGVSYAGACTHGRDFPPSLLRGRCAFGLRHLPAGSSRSQAESSSLALRTNRSPRVAPHPASRRRSYLRVREAKPPLDGDFHPADSNTITGALATDLQACELSQAWRPVATKTMTSSIRLRTRSLQPALRDKAFCESGSRRRDRGGAHEHCGR